MKPTNVNSGKWDVSALSLYKSRRAVIKFFAILFFLLPFVANSECLPQATPNADDILCTATDTNGVVSSGGDDTITVLSNATVTVQGVAPVTSVTAIDAGNGSDTAINFGSVFAGLLAETTSEVNVASIPVLRVQDYDTWNQLLATGINLGNGGDHVGNHGSLVVAAVLNPSVQPQVANVSSDQNTETLTTEIAALGIVGGNSADVIENTGQLTVAAIDNTGTNVATAVGISSGNGKDIITNTGNITVTAASAQPAVIPQVDVLQPTTASTANNPQDETQPPLMATAIGIDGGNAKDAVTTNTGSLVVESSSDSGASPANALGILAGNGKDVVFNDGTISVTSEVVQSDSSWTATLTGGDDLVATTSLDASATGIDSGNGGDIITNDGTIISEALAELSSLNVELNLVDTSHADTSVTLNSNAAGIVTGNAKDTVTNTGSIDANATSRLDSINVEINGADAGLADSANLLDSAAMALATGAGNDTIATTGSINASATSEMDEVGVNVSFADVTIADREGSDTSTRLYAYATGIDSGSGSDNIYIDALGSVGANALSDVHSIGVSIASEGVPSSTESLFIDGSLADVSIETNSEATAIVTGQGNDELFNFGNVTSDATANSSQTGVNVGIALIDFVVPTPGIVLGGGGTSADATSLGFDSGIGNDVINNAGMLDVDAESDASSTIVSVNLAELSIGGVDAIPGLGAAVVAADTTTNATSNASGITAGDGHDDIDNTGTIDVYADAHGSSTSAAAGLGIQVGKGDNALQIDVVLARAETQSDASASGISGDDGKDNITNSGNMIINSLAETDALGIGIDISGTLRGSGGAIGATLTDTSSTSTAHSVGIDGGDNKDTIVNSGTLDVDATADTNNINATVTAGFVQKGLVAGVALGRAETEGNASATGIDGGEGLDTITNDGTVDVKAKSDADSVAVSVTVGGTAQGLAVGAALADGGATAVANATGIRSGDETVDNSGCQQEQQTQLNCHSTNNPQDEIKPEIVNNNSIIVAAEADTNSTAISADVQIAKDGAAIGAALADNSSRAEATSVGVEGNERENVIVNNGNIQLKSDADADAVSVGVTVQGTSSGLAAGAALTNASVHSNASATGIQTGDGDDVVINTGSILTGNETEQQVQSTATAVGVSVSSQLNLKAGASIGAALADTDAGAVTQLTAIDGEQGDDQIINQGAINFQNVGANADAVSVSVEVALSPAGLAAGAAVANSDSTAELTANGLVGADGKDLLVNESTIDLHNMTADADAVSVSLAVSGTQAGVSLSGALVDADATATASATGLDGGNDEDRLYNEGAINIDGIHANTDAVGVGVGFSFAGQGVAASAALARSGATSNANATGLDGGAADDKLINDGSITLNNINADADAVSVSVSGAGTSAGVALSAGLTDASGRANANVTGMDGGSGNDYLRNNNAITVTDVDSDAHATGISISAQFSAGGVAAGLSLANTSAIANTFVTGMDGGEGDDLIINSGDIGLEGTATADALSVALSITASVGVGGGASITDASSTAQSTVMGIDGGEGLDDITNDGDVAVTSIAVTESTSASVGITVAVGGDVTLADAQSTSTATAVGIYDPAETLAPIQENTVIVAHHDSGDDQQPLSELINLGNVTSIAIADSEGLAISGNLLGYALGETTNISTADAAGIRYFQGPALIYNEGTITSNSLAIAEGMAVAVTLGGAAVGDTSTTATAFASGIESAGGDDEVVNSSKGESSAINVDARSYASGESISVGLVGVQIADTTNTANAVATGINTGDGDDVVLNESVMNISAGNPLNADGTANCTETAGGACAESFGLSVTLAGYGAVDGTSIASANAVGITAGEGSDIIQNDNAITVTTLARSNAESIGVTLLGANDSDASTVATAVATGLSGAAGDDRLVNLGDLTVLSGTETNADSFTLAIAGASSAGADAIAAASATGLSGGEGHDKLVNEGSLTIATHSQSMADSMSVTIFGGASASADTTTNATSIAMDGGADNDLIVNSETGTIGVYASTQSVADASSWNFAGAASAQATLGALTDSFGILGGSGEDWIENHGGMQVETYSDLNAYGSGENIFGHAAAGTEITATASATGIDSGADDDVIKNNAVIEVASTGDMYSKATSFSLIGGSATDELITAGSHSIGINSGAGNDKVYNWNEINVDATSLLLAEGGSSVGIGGDAASAATVGATTSGQGIVTGDGDDTVVSFEGSVVDVNVAASPKADTESSAGIYWSDGVIRSTAVSSSQGYGFNVGDGNNGVLSEGDISVALSGKTEARGTSTADDVSNYLGIDVDAYATTVAELKQNLAYGIKAGGGNNVVENHGTINVSSTAEAESYANANGQAIASGDGTAHATGRADSAYASGIETGDGDNLILNHGTVIVSNTVNSDVDTDSDADGIGEFREPDSKSTSVASANIVMALGIRSGHGVNEIINKGIVSVTAAPTADADADADYGGDVLGIDSEAKTFVSVDGVRAYGIWAGDGGNWIWNQSQASIVVAAAPLAKADSFANGVGNDGDAGVRADAHANNTYAIGIQTGNGEDSILNDGEIDVNSSPTADTRAISSPSGFSLNSGENEFGDGTTPGQWADAKNALAIGISSNGGNDWIVNTGSIISEMHATALVNGSSPHLDSSGTAIGIDGGTGDNIIDNSGTLLATALTNTDDIVSGHVASDASSLGVGIHAGDGYNEIFNTGTLQANATAMASLADVLDLVIIAPIPLPGGDADSVVAGIRAGDGGNLIINDGIIDVTATARGDGLRVSATAYGIQTGDGGDNIINNGTINTSEVLETGIGIDGLTITETLGIAIDSGGGDDTVVLGDGSVTNGDIDLGTGTDTLSMEGTPIINGNIIDDMSSLMLSFNNSGSYDGELPGMRAEKNGEGTFALSTLPQLDYLAVNEGTLQLNNDYVFQENGDFRATVYGGGSNGQFLVNGSAALGGQIEIVRGRGAYLDGTTYDVLSANNGIAAGTVFNNITLPEDRPLLSFQLNQVGNTMQVAVDVESFITVAQSENAMAVARHLDSILPSVEGGLNYAMGEVQVLSQDSEFANAFYGLSPAAHDHLTQGSFASAQQYINTITARMNNLQFSELVGPDRQLKEGQYKLAAAGTAPQGLFVRGDNKYKYGGYVRAFGQRGEQDATANNNGYDFTLNGLTVGMDNKLDNHYIVGASLGYASNDVDADGNSSSGEIDSTLASVYGSYLFDRGYVDASLSYGRNSYDSRRNVVIGMSTTRLNSSHDADLLSLGVSGGRYYQTGDWWMRPFVSLQYTRLDEDRFTERGGATSLNVKSRTTESLVSQLGVSFLRDYKTKSGYITPELSIAWLHDFDIDDRSISASYTGAPDSTFSIRGQKVEKNGFIAGAGFSYETRAGYITTLKVNSEYRDEYSANTIIGEFRYQF